MIAPIKDLKNNSFFRYSSTSSLPTLIKEPYPTYIGAFYGSFIVKCYGIDLPMHGEYFGLEMNKTIFPGGIRPNSFGLGLSLHYPNQFFRSFNNIRWHWPNPIQIRNQSLEMLIKMKIFEVTIRRNSRWNQCRANWKEHDFDVAKRHLETVGCRTVYEVRSSNYQLCNSSEKMAMSLNWNVPQIMEPCQSSDKIVYEEFDNQYKNLNFFSADSFVVWIDMRMSKIKVIEHKQAYNLQNLIANSGGYIGLFLGIHYIHNCNLYAILKND